MRRKGLTTFVVRSFESGQTERLITKNGVIVRLRN